MQTDQQEKRINRAILAHTIPVTILVAIAVVSYWSFYEPILYDDDWSLVIGRWYFDKLKWVDWENRRPLQLTPLMILYGIFGLNLHAFYIVLWLLNIIAAIQLYFLTLKFTSKNIAIAFSIAAVFLIYPADFTHMWVTMVGIRLAVILTLAYAHLLLIYANTGRRSLLWIALFFLVISLARYEGQFGITMAWCLVLVLMKRTILRKERLGLLLPFMVGFVFMLWRTIGYSVTEVNDNYLTGFQLTPLVIIGRLVAGYRIMVWAWVEPITHALALNRWLTMLAILVTLVLCGFLILMMRRGHKRKDIKLTEKQREIQLRTYMFMVLVGSMFIAAGYIPTIAIFSPTFYSVHSRMNIFALPGAAVTIVALLNVVLLLGMRNQSQINSTVVIVISPLILLGMLIQIGVQYDNRVAWAQQKQIWQELFELAPDIEDGTKVYFLLPDDQQGLSLNKYSRRSPLRVSWEIASAHNVIY
jgi:hypothetical protein